MTLANKIRFFFLGLGIVATLVLAVAHHYTPDGVTALALEPVVPAIFCGLLFSMVTKGDPMGFIMLGALGFGMAGTLWVASLARENAWLILGHTGAPGLTWLGALLGPASIFCSFLPPMFIERK